MAGQTRSERSVVLTPPPLRDHYPVAVCNINHLKIFWKSGRNHLYHQRYHQFMILDILERGGHPILYCSVTRGIYVLKQLDTVSPFYKVAVNEGNALIRTYTNNPPSSTPAPRGPRVYPRVNWPSGAGCSPPRAVCNGTKGLPVELHFPAGAGES